MIHSFSINNTNIVLDVYSGAVHVLDDLAYAVLTGNTEQYSEESVAEAQKEIDTLISCGRLFSQPPKGTKEKETAFTKDRPQIVKSLCMHIAHDCNLRCKYCFAGEGDYSALVEKVKKAEKSRTLMSPEIGKKAIDFLIANSGSRRNLEVDFFGGEPTLNFDTVKAVIEYAGSREAEAGKNFRFTFTTNGLLLDDDKIEYINRHMDNVVLSLDGRKEVNDKMRIMKGNRLQNVTGCYDRIVPKFRQLVEARNHQNYYMRGTYTSENLDFSRDVLHIADLGFSQISVEPVIGPPDAFYSIKKEHIPALCEEYERLAIQMLEREKGERFNFFHFMLDLEGGPCAAKRITGCGAGTEYLACTPEGDLYPCHQFVGDEQFRLGNLDAGIVQTAGSGTSAGSGPSTWQEQFSRCNVYTKPECDACWAKYFCSGGCAANAFYTNGNIMEPDLIGCELQKKRLECALYLLAARVV